MASVILLLDRHMFKNQHVRYKHCGNRVHSNCLHLKSIDIYIATYIYTRWFQAYIRSTRFCVEQVSMEIFQYTFTDQPYQLRSLCIMAEFQTSNCCYSKKYAVNMAQLLLQGNKVCSMAISNVSYLNYELWSLAYSPLYARSLYARLRKHEIRLRTIKKSKTRLSFKK